MSIYDALERKAVEMGKTPAEFSAAAQRHANMTWVWALVGGVVWYFADWQWALIPAALGLLSAFQSVSSTVVATRLAERQSRSSDN